jgi:hypothetical protein
VSPAAPPTPSPLPARARLATRIVQPALAPRSLNAPHVPRRGPFCRVGGASRRVARTSFSTRRVEHARRAIAPVRAALVLGHSRVSPAPMPTAPSSVDPASLHNVPTLRPSSPRLARVSPPSLPSRTLSVVRSPQRRYPPSPVLILPQSSTTTAPPVAASNGGKFC